MRSRYKRIILSALVTVVAVAAVVSAGNPDNPPGPPESTYSYTLADIYDRLDTGVAGTQSAWSEPVSGPGTGTGRTLDEIMAVAPAVDNTHGATQTHVLAGMTAWGLTSGEWGIMTGTMPNRGSMVIVPTASSQTIAAGYHDGGGYVTGDAALVGWNIRSGATIFGVGGTCYRLPATGQTSCWNEYGTSVPCPGTGQDGEYHLGCMPLVEPCVGEDGCGFNRTSLPWASSGGTGFVDLGDGTVRDTLTGLIWLQDANCIASEYPGFDNDDTAGDGAVEWQHALDFVAGINSGLYPNCGASFTDWRLSNINELRSLIDPAQSNPALPVGHPFVGVEATGVFYWSSTTDVDAEFYAWFQYLYGTAPTHHGDKRNDTHYVWPVRGGQ